jgi:hypothetical protein
MKDSCVWRCNGVQESCVYETEPKKFHCIVVTREHEHKVRSGKRREMLHWPSHCTLLQAEPDKETKETRFVYSLIPFVVYIVWNFDINIERALERGFYGTLAFII